MTFTYCTKRLLAAKNNFCLQSTDIRSIEYVTERTRVPPRLIQLWRLGCAAAAAVFVYQVTCLIYGSCRSLNSKVSWTTISMHSRKDLSYTSKDYFNLRLLVDHKNTTRGFLKRVPQTNRLNKGTLRVTKQRIRKTLPCLERGIRFGGVCG